MDKGQKTGTNWSYKVCHAEYDMSTGKTKEMTSYKGNRIARARVSVKS